MIKWTRANKQYPNVDDGPVYTKDKDNNIRIMELACNEAEFEGGIVSMFFKDNLSNKGFMHWKEVNSDYTCRYSHVINWSYVKECPNAEEFYPILKIK